MPGETSSSSSRARSRPRTVFTGSCAFSKRMEASVRSFSREEVLRTLDALKFALSSTMRVVASEIALPAPPMTPASAIAPAAIRDHQIRRIQFVRLAVQRGEAFTRARARRTIISPPWSFSASKACMGWASSAIT